MPITSNLLNVKELAKSNISNLEKKSEGADKEKSNQNLKEKKGGDSKDTQTSPALAASGKSGNEVKKAAEAAAKGKPSTASKLAKDISKAGVAGGLTGAMSMMASTLGSGLQGDNYKTDGLNNKFFKGLGKTLNVVDKALGIFNDVMCCKYKSADISKLSGMMGSRRRVSSNLDLSFGLSICKNSMANSPFNMLLNMARGIPVGAKKPKFDWKAMVFGMLDATLPLVSPLLGRLSKAAQECLFKKSLTNAYHGYAYGGLKIRSEMHSQYTTKGCLNSFMEALLPGTTSMISKPSLTDSIASLTTALISSTTTRHTSFAASVGATTIVSRATTRASMDAAFNSRNSNIIVGLLRELLTGSSRSRDSALTGMLRFGGYSSHESYTSIVRIGAGVRVTKKQDRKSVLEEVSSYIDTVDFTRSRVTAHRFTGGIYTPDGRYISGSTIQWAKFRDRSRSLTSAKRYATLDYGRVEVETITEYKEEKEETLDGVITLSNGIKVDAAGNAIIPDYTITSKHRLQSVSRLGIGIRVGSKVASSYSGADTSRVGLLEAEIGIGTSKAQSVDPISRRDAIYALDAMGLDSDPGVASVVVNKVDARSTVSIQDLAKKTQKPEDESLSNKEDPVALSIRVKTVRTLIESGELKPRDLVAMGITADTLLGNLATVVDLVNSDAQVDKVAVYEDILYLLDTLDPNWCKDDEGNLNYSKVVYNEVIHTLAMNHLQHRASTMDLDTNVKQTTLTRDHIIVMTNVFHLTETDIPFEVKELQKCKC